MLIKLLIIFIHKNANSPHKEQFAQIQNPVHKTESFDYKHILVVIKVKTGHKIVFMLKFHEVFTYQKYFQFIFTIFLFFAPL